MSVFGPGSAWSSPYLRSNRMSLKFQPLPGGQVGASWVQFPGGEILVVHNGAMAADAPRACLLGCYLGPSDVEVPVPDNGKAPRNKGQ